MGAETRRAERRGDVHPSLGRTDRLFSPAGIGIVEAPKLVHRNVDNVRPGLFHGFAQLVNVTHFKRAEVGAERFDVSHIETLDDHAGELLEVHAGLFSVAAPGTRAFDESAEWIGSDGQPVSRLGREI